MPSKDKYKLAGLMLEEISLVDNPANVDAKVSIYKRAETRDQSREAAGASGNPPIHNKEDNMSDVEKMGEQLEDLKKQVEQLTAERDEALAKVAKGAEEVEYIEFQGEKIEKSAVPAPVLKALEAQGAALAKMEADREADALVKRANAELPHLAGDVTAKAKLLKAAEGIDGAMDILKSADKAFSMALAEKGHSNTEENSALEELDQLAKSYASDKGVSYHEAYAEVTKSGRGAELFAKRHAQ